MKSKAGCGWKFLLLNNNALMNRNHFPKVFMLNSFESKKDKKIILKETYLITDFKIDN